MGVKSSFSLTWYLMEGHTTFQRQCTIKAESGPLLSVSTNLEEHAYHTFIVTTSSHRLFFSAFTQKVHTTGTHTHTCTLPLHQNCIATGLAITCLLKRNEKSVESRKRYGFSLFNVEWEKKRRESDWENQLQLCITQQLQLSIWAEKSIWELMTSWAFHSSLRNCLEATHTHTLYINTDWV